MSTAKIYLFANWKMYLDATESERMAKQLAAYSKRLPTAVETVIFPSSLAFQGVAKAAKGSRLGVGAQNVYWVEKGGYTGEISAAMYKRAGARYALVGHSERRHLFHESNHETAQKVEAVVEAGMLPVVCVGETASERAAGQTEEVVEAQLRAAYSTVVWPLKKNPIIAYEPVWAISHGTGKDQAGKYCEPAEAEKMHHFIIKIVHDLLPAAPEPVVLYGGSVRPDTVTDYLSEPNVGGVLVGAASTVLSSWKTIIADALK